MVVRCGTRAILRWFRVGFRVVRSDPLVVLVCSRDDSRVVLRWFRNGTKVALS